MSEKIENDNRDVIMSPDTLEQIKKITRILQKSAEEKGVDMSEIDVIIDDGGIHGDGNESSDENVIREKDTTKVNNYTISVVEFAIFNSFFYDCCFKEIAGIKTDSYGTTNSDTGAICYGGAFTHVDPWWFNIKFNTLDTRIYVQTLMFKDSWGQLNYRLSLSVEDGIAYNDYNELFKNLKQIAFNCSEYKGKCLKVKIHEGCFRGIEIINSEEFNKDLVLNDVQLKFIDHYINRLKRGSVVRYLFNGQPGSGKTESIRQIMFKLSSIVTFVIPDFEDVRDLTEILEACEIFDPSVIVLDDIDLYLGSRDKGNYTRLLGQFLSFFDGVKKRKISLLASTNDKGLVDTAASRPGRFNVILDFGFLDVSQIETVVNMYFPKEYQIPEIYNKLKGNTSNGLSIKVTGAFIANLAENIKEMMIDDVDWDVEATKTLISETYKGFYQSQISKNKNIGFNIDSD